MELRCCSILHFFLIQGFKVDEVVKVVKDFKVINDSQFSILNSQFSILLIVVVADFFLYGGVNHGYGGEVYDVAH